MPKPPSPRDDKKRLGPRPSKAGRTYVLELLREHCLMPDVPGSVADAVLQVLIRKGVLEEGPKGHFEVKGRQGATLELPQLAGRAVHRATCALLNRDPSLSVLGRVVLGTGASGSGAVGSGPSRGPLEAATRRLASAEEDLKRLEWHKEDVVAGFGKDLESEGRVITEHVLEEMRQECDALERAVAVDKKKAKPMAKAVSARKPLHETAQIVLDVILAHPAGRAMPLKDLWKKAKAKEAGVALDRIQKIVADLKKRGLVDSSKKIGVWHGEATFKASDAAGSEKNDK